MFDGFLDKMAGLAGGPIPPQDQDYYEEDEEEEGGTFVALDPTSTSSVDGSGEGTFGPLAVLAVGFLAAEFAALQDLMDEIGAEEVALVPATRGLLGGTLGEALSADPPPDHPGDGEAGPPPQKILFLSGMYASEVVEVVSAVKEAPGVPGCAFAAAVPRSWGRELGELVADVAADHAAMAARRAAAEAAADDDA